MAFVLVVMMFATEPAGDGTPEVILMVHGFSIFSVLLSLQFQHAPTAIIAVRGMTRPPFVIDRITVEEWGYTCYGFHLIHGTYVIPSFTSTLVGVSGGFRPSRLTTIRGGIGTFTQVPLEELSRAPSQGPVQ